MRVPVPASIYILSRSLIQMMSAQFFKSWPHFRPKNVIFNTRFQTWTRSQNATYMFTQTEVMSSLLRLEGQQNHFLKFIAIRICTLSFYLELKHYTTVVPQFQTKMGKNCTRFRTKTAQKPYPLGRHWHAYMAFIREYPPPRAILVFLRIHVIVWPSLKVGVISSLW